MRADPQTLLAFKLYLPTWKYLRRQGWPTCKVLFPKTFLRAESTWSCGWPSVAGDNYLGQLDFGQPRDDKGIDELIGMEGLPAEIHLGDTGYTSQRRAIGTTPTSVKPRILKIGSRQINQGDLEAFMRFMPLRCTAVMYLLVKYSPVRHTLIRCILIRA